MVLSESGSRISLFDAHQGGILGNISRCSSLTYSPDLLFISFLHTHCESPAGPIWHYLQRSMGIALIWMCGYTLLDKEWAPPFFFFWWAEIWWWCPPAITDAVWWIWRTGFIHPCTYGNGPLLVQVRWDHDRVILLQILFKQQGISFSLWRSFFFVLGAHAGYGQCFVTWQAFPVW